MMLISGYTGQHPLRGIEAAAVAPYPCAGDVQIDGVWLSDAPHLTEILDQAYDFGSGELKTRFKFRVGDVCAGVEVLTFCDRVEPTVVCQEITVVADSRCLLQLKSIVDASKIDGRALRQSRATPAECKPSCDGAILWESAGGLSTCGIDYFTELHGSELEPNRSPFANLRFESSYRFRGRKNHRYVLRQVASIVPDRMHDQPDYQASRLIAMSRGRGFDAIRAGNRGAWSKLWKGRIHLVGAESRWQAKMPGRMSRRPALCSPPPERYSSWRTGSGGSGRNCGRAGMSAHDCCGSLI